MKMVYTKTPTERRGGFTLMELLVVIAIIALLMSIMMPALSKVKEIAKATVCQSSHRQILTATMTYSVDFKDNIPYFGEQTNPPAQDKGPFWFEKLAPYMSIKDKEDSSTSIYNKASYMAEVRKCPSGKKRSNMDHDCWIGPNFCNDGRSAPYYYRGYPGYERPALKISSFRQNAGNMIYMDVLTHFVYSPVDSRYRFDQDRDGDGVFDSNSQLVSGDYNEGRPKVHGGSTNVSLMDGHVERVKFDDLWEIDQTTREMIHDFWYMN